jgi:hypothetical protein
MPTVDSIHSRDSRDSQQTKESSSISPTTRRSHPGLIGDHIHHQPLDEVNDDTNNNNNNSNSVLNIFPSDRPDGKGFIPSRRRFSANARMDASSAMQRLRTTMVGRTAATIEIWDDHHHDPTSSSRKRSLSFSTGDENDNNHDAVTNRGGRHHVNTTPFTPLSPSYTTTDHPSMTTTTTSSSTTITTTPKRFSRDQKMFCVHYLRHTFGQIPAIALIGIFHLMIGIPFGVSYFPMYWNSHPGSDTHVEKMNDDGTDEGGGFPIPGGKEALGIRMFLFATFIGQIIFTCTSGFPNPIGLQMVENIGFTKALSAVAISHQGYGLDALATVLLMFGLASILVGIVFYALGKFQCGKVVYFFPTHVLIGLIGGIGVLIGKTGIEVTIADTLTFGSLVQQWRLWIVVAGLEVLLRFLEYVTTDSTGKPRFSLLSPIFFCTITPLFYAVLWIFHVPMSEANDAGYFFPSLDNSVENESLSMNSAGFGTPWDMWKVRSTMFSVRGMILVHLLLGFAKVPTQSSLSSSSSSFLELIGHRIFQGVMEGYLGFTTNDGCIGFVFTHPCPHQHTSIRTFYKSRCRYEPRIDCTWIFEYVSGCMWWIAKLHGVHAICPI